MIVKFLPDMRRGLLSCGSTEQQLWVIANEYGNVNAYRHQDMPRQMQALPLTMYHLPGDY